jgi:hypothetical protein
MARSETRRQQWEKRWRPCVSTAAIAWGSSAVATWKMTPPGAGGVEHAVDDDAMEVQMRIEGGTEAVDEGDRAEARRRARTKAVRAQALLHLA